MSSEGLRIRLISSFKMSWIDSWLLLRGNGACDPAALPLFIRFKLKVCALITPSVCQVKPTAVPSLSACRCHWDNSSVKCDVFTKVEILTQICFYLCQLKPDNTLPPCTDSGCDLIWCGVSSLYQHQCQLSAGGLYNLQIISTFLSVSVSSQDNCED